MNPSQVGLRTRLTNFPVTGVGIDRSSIRNRRVCGAQRNVPTDGLTGAFRYAPRTLRKYRKLFRTRCNEATIKIARRSGGNRDRFRESGVAAAESLQDVGECQNGVAGRERLAEPVEIRLASAERAVRFPHHSTD